MLFIRRQAVGLPPHRTIRQGRLKRLIVVDAIQAVVFDAYGTLFDVHSVVTQCDQLFPGRGKELSHLWRSKQLEYTWLRSLMGRYEDFESITRAALLHSCRALGLPLSETGGAMLMQQYLHLDTYPEVAERAAIPRRPEAGHLLQWLAGNAAGGGFQCRPEVRLPCGAERRSSCASSSHTRACISSRWTSWG